MQQSGHDQQPAGASTVAAAVTAQTCATCAASGAPGGDGGGASFSPSYVYAIGRIEPRFPRLSIEKEFAQATGRLPPGGLTDRQAMHAVLTKRENRYLLRQMCWVMTIAGMETYLLVPRDPGDVPLLLDSIRPAASPLDLDVVIGIKGPIAPPDMCNGLMVPIVAFDQIYSFDRAALIKSIPKPEGIAAKDFASAAEELFDRVIQLTDNAGATDENRALNYLSVRYHQIYAEVAEAHSRNESLSGVAVQHSSLSLTRRLVEVIFTFTGRTTDVVRKSFMRVDVTEEFPFLATRLSPYYDRLM
jgi:hypothetical protein